MQWLIDIIIEKIGIPPTFINRGDTADWDWEVGDFTIDDNWHELDLSAIVPAGAQAVLFTVWLKADAVAKHLFLRYPGNTDRYTAVGVQTQTANVLVLGNLVCPCNENRKVEYQIIAATWEYIRVSVIGWWL